MCKGGEQHEVTLRIWWNCDQRAIVQRNNVFHSVLMICVDVVV